MDKTPNPSVDRCQYTHIYNVTEGHLHHPQTLQLHTRASKFK